MKSDLASIAQKVSSSDFHCFLKLFLKQSCRDLWCWADW